MCLPENLLSIQGVVDEIPHARDFVSVIARQAGMDEQAIQHCQLAVDEACTNIIEHAYQSNRERSIEIKCTYTPFVFTIIITDDGPAFNPLLRTDPDPRTELHERGEGGWGVYFIKQLMDEVYYMRNGSYNHFTMQKHLKQAG